MYKLIVSLVAVALVVVAAGAAWGLRPSSPASCCVAGAECCYEGSPCCPPECCPPDCCYEGSPCCFEGSPCCEGSAECCEPASSCCAGGKK